MNAPKGNRWALSPSPVGDQVELAIWRPSTDPRYSTEQLHRFGWVKEAELEQLGAAIAYYREHVAPKLRLLCSVTVPINGNLLTFLVKADENSGHTIATCRACEEVVVRCIRPMFELPEPWLQLFQRHAAGCPKRQ